jgi:hypothetical protein
VKFNPVVQEEICTKTITETVEIPMVRKRQERENISSPAPANSVSSVPAVSGRDGRVLGNCRTKILINGKEQEVHSKEINWRWP